MAEGESSGAVEVFRRLGEARTFDVFEGALLVARLIDPAADLEGARARVEELGRRVADRRAAGAAPLDALREVLFAEEGFAGDTESYDEPRNSSVVRALSDRRGMPITLSVAVREVGRRAGVRLEGVGLPGHFVLGGPDLPDGLFLDPFHGGLLCDSEALARRVSAILGTPVALSAEVLAPDPEPSILRRMLSNLCRSYARRQRFEEAFAVLDCAEAFLPEDPSVPRERALLLAKAGYSDEDRKALEPPATRRIFTLEEARGLLPRIRERTTEAVESFAKLPAGSAEAEETRREILTRWAEEVAALGVEIKGPWLVDFDSGAGYYCWKHPERALEFFHGYEEGFAGRLPLQ